MIPAIKLSPALVAGGLLAVSLLVNLWQINLHVKGEKKLTEAQESIKKLKDDLAAQERLTGACSDSVAALKREAELAAEASKAAIAAAQEQNKTKTTRAIKTLSTPPSVPGDQCKSITSLVGDWRKGRAQ